MSNRSFQDNNYRQICSEKTLQSNAKGFFLDFGDFVAAEVGEKWIKSIFGKLKTDEERIKCVYTSKETKKHLENFLSNVQEIFRAKNSEFSQKRRLEAETILKKNNATKSLLLYSQSVLRAPQIDSSLSLALALWGRAQALIKLEKFANALVDIQQALKEHLPGTYKAQAFWKMGFCYNALKEPNKAKVSFDLAEKLLQNDKGQLKALNEDRHKIYPADKKNDLLLEKPEVDESGDLPNASRKLSMKASKNMGRYIVANQKISCGETLVIEPPYAACLLPEVFGSHCHHCFKILEAPYGCPDCASVAFCSIQCKNESISTYHKYECRYLDLLIGSGMSILGHTALRMVTKNGLEKCLEIYKNKDKEKIYKLCTNAHLRSPEDFLQRTLMAAFLLRCLQKSNFFGKASEVAPTKTEFQIGEMLLYNLQILQFNAHEIYETRHSPEHRIRGSKTVYIGVAVYLTASLFNHDCHSALSRYFMGKDIVLIAERPLEPNELIPENYGPIFTRRSLIERRRSLSSRYWFECQCIACQQDWPAIGRGLEDATERFKCPTDECKHVFTMSMVKIATECPKCKIVVDLSGRVLLLKWCTEQYDLAFNLMDRDESKKAIDLLCIAIDTFYKISVPPHKSTHRAEEMLRACHADKGNTWKVLSNSK